MKHPLLHPAAWMILGACCGVAAAMLLWARPDAQRETLNQRATQFQELSEEQRRLVRLSYNDLKSQSTERQLQVASIHAALQHDTRLATTLERYSSWQQAPMRCSRRTPSQHSMGQHGQQRWRRRHCCPRCHQMHCRGSLN